MIEQDEKFMSVALDIAGNGRGSVEPNPMVGAVIVRDGVELGRGWHGRFGGPHAEIEALRSAAAAGKDVRGATLYVTLEPCCHFGKTPPCTSAVIQAGIARVVAAMPDPDTRVAGKGLDLLCKAGIEVTCGVLERQARTLLGAYIKLRTKGRPWVILKWAQTADGYLAMPDRRWISGEEARRRTHELRGMCDGILVGVGTVLADDPLLNNRSGFGRQPTRVVLDGRLRIPLHCRLVKTANDSPVIVATTQTAIDAKPDIVLALRRAGAEVLELPVCQPVGSATSLLDLGALLNNLGRRQWTHLLVEGGGKVLESFVQANLADEVLAFVSPDFAGSQSAEKPKFNFHEVRNRIGLEVDEPILYGKDLTFRGTVPPT